MSRVAVRRHFQTATPTLSHQLHLHQLQGVRKGVRRTAERLLCTSLHHQALQRAGLWSAGVLGTSRGAKLRWALPRRNCLPNAVKQPKRDGCLPFLWAHSLFLELGIPSTSPTLTKTPDPRILCSSTLEPHQGSATQGVAPNLQLPKAPRAVLTQQHQGEAGQWQCLPGSSAVQDPEHSFSPDLLNTGVWVCSQLRRPGSSQGVGKL